MKLKLCACLAAGALLAGTQALAAPLSTPFLGVDVNGYNAGGGQTLGPTAAGYVGLEAAEGLFLDPSIDWGNSGAAGLTKVAATSQGNVTVNLSGSGSFLGARNRGANSDQLSDISSDFVFVQRDSAIAFGRNYVKVTLSGLAANTAYEVTTFARDHFNGGTDSFQAWTDRASLGGLDGPAAWLDANVAAGASYQPAVGGVNNPIPTMRRSPVSGPASVNAYDYAATFITTSDASGVVTVYGWSDPNSFSGVQGASLLNGIQIGPQVPEPTSAGLVSLALLSLAGLRRRSG